MVAALITKILMHIDSKMKKCSQDKSIKLHTWLLKTCTMGERDLQIEALDLTEIEKVPELEDMG